MSIAQQTRSRPNLPYALASGVFFSQIGIGIILFATFQEFVPSQLNAGDAWPGYLLGAYGGARFLAETPAGALSDRMERRRGLLAGYVLMIPAIVLMAVVRDQHAYLLFAAQLGLATAFLWPATYAISADLYPPERRGTVIGVLNLAQLLGFGVGAITGALLVESLPGLMFACAIAAVVVAFGVTIARIPGYREATARADGVPRPRLIDILSPQLIALSAIIVTVSTALSMLVPAIRPFGEDQVGVSFATLTIALLPAVVVGAALFVPAGQIADRFGRSVPLFAGQALLVAGLFAVAETETLWVAAVLAAVVFAGNVMAVPAWNAAIMDLAPASHRGTIIGLSVALSGFGLAVGPALGGVIVSQSGAPAVFRTAAGLCALAGVAIALYGYRYRTHPVRSPSEP